MQRLPVSTLLKVTRTLFFVDAALWLVFAVLGTALAATSGDTLRWVLSALMAANAAVLAGFGLRLVPERVRVFDLAILYMVLNAVLSITDQFGVVDALVLAFSLTLLGCAFITRMRILRDGRAAPGEG